jgi:hypothetical protein
MHILNHYLFIAVWHHFVHIIRGHAISSLFWEAKSDTVWEKKDRWLKFDIYCKRAYMCLCICYVILENCIILYHIDVSVLDKCFYSVIMVIKYVLILEGGNCQSTNCFHMLIDSLSTTTFLRIEKVFINELLTYCSKLAFNRRIKQNITIHEQYYNEW